MIPAWAGGAGLLLLGAVATLGGCTRTAPPVAPSSARYVVGSAYQAGGVWYYPREQLDYDATGLAVVAPDRSGLTATGEAFDQAVPAAAHQTLQLPSVVRVTNLENGRQVSLRLNDRGPASPARLVQLTRRAAELLGVPPNGVARVRVQLDTETSRQLASYVGGGPLVQVASAPRAAVRAESLAPPSGATQSGRVRLAAQVVGAAADSVPAGPDGPPTVAETVRQVSASPGQLWLRAGEFGRRAYADQLRARLAGTGARVEPEQRGRDQVFRVRAGPFGTVRQADSALDQALRAGVTDARIVVE